MVIWICQKTEGYPELKFRQPYNGDDSPVDGQLRVMVNGEYKWYPEGHFRENKLIPGENIYDEEPK